MATILVAEDSSTQAVQIRGLLEAAAFQVQTVQNGLEALARLAEQSADVLLTDLNMPQMNGLELVVAARREFPQVPVVVMTAFGSEEIAVRALQNGAASYVPKRNLARDLVDTLRDVLDIARVGREDAQLGEFLSSLAASFVLPSTSPPIMAVVGYVQEGMLQLRLGDTTDRVRIAVALDTAIHNVLLYGSLELSAAEVREAYTLHDAGESLLGERAHSSPYAERNIHVRVGMTPQEIRLVVRHEGPGFNSNDMFETPDSEQLDGDRACGWLLVNSFMDEVCADEQGTEVTLVRRFGS